MEVIWVKGRWEFLISLLQSFSKYKIASETKRMSLQPPAHSVLTLWSQKLWHGCILCGLCCSFPVLLSIPQHLSLLTSTGNRMKTLALLATAAILRGFLVCDWPQGYLVNQLWPPLLLISWFKLDLPWSCERSFPCRLWSVFKPKHTPVHCKMLWSSPPQ